VGVTGRGTHVRQLEVEVDLELEPHDIREVDDELGI
jgi:hypothetical protein